MELHVYNITTKYKDPSTNRPTADQLRQILHLPRLYKAWWLTSGSICVYYS